MTQSTAPTATRAAEHDCGLCDAPIVWDGHDEAFGDLWRCVRCDWTHVSMHCCSGMESCGDSGCADCGVA